MPPHMAVALSDKHIGTSCGTAAFAAQGMGITVITGI